LQTVAKLCGAAAIALIVLGALLEALQLLTPDRSANLFGAIYSDLGAIAAAVLTALVIRGRRWAGSMSKSVRGYK
jgi:VanZ family protein